MKESFRRYRFVLIAFFILVFAFSCAVTKNIYLERTAQSVEHYIDSLSNEYSLNVESDYTKWPSMSFFGSDSVKTVTYSGIAEVEDTVYIFTVLDNSEKDLIFRFRREVYKK